jgi:hypothetical protein
MSSFTAVEGVILVERAVLTMTLTDEVVAVLLLLSVTLSSNLYVPVVVDEVVTNEHVVVVGAAQLTAFE